MVRTAHFRSHEVFRGDLYIEVIHGSMNHGSGLFYLTVPGVLVHFQRSGKIHVGFKVQITISG